MTNFSSPATPHLFHQQLEQHSQHPHPNQPPIASPILPSTMTDGSSPVLIHPHLQMATPLHTPQNPPTGALSTVNPSSHSHFPPYWNDQVSRLSQPNQAAYQIFMTQPQAPIPRPRKPYTATKVREMWSAAEHERMLEGLRLYKRDWAKVTQYVGTRSAAQVRSHAQKYFDKVARDKSDEFVPRPRPKRKSAAPYPRKPREDRQSVAVPVPVPIPITPSSVALPFHMSHVLPLPTATHSPIIQQVSQPSTPYISQSLSRQMYPISNPSPVSFLPSSHFSSPSLVQSPLHPPPHGTISPVTPFQHPSSQQSPHYVPYVTGASHVHGPQLSNITPLSNSSVPRNNVMDPYSMPLHSHPNGMVDNCSKCIALQRYGNVLQELCVTSQAYESGCAVQESNTCQVDITNVRPSTTNGQNITDSPSSVISYDSNGKTRNKISTPTIPNVTASSVDHRAHILGERAELQNEPTRIMSGKEKELLDNGTMEINEEEDESKRILKSEDEEQGDLISVKSGLRVEHRTLGKRSKYSDDNVETNIESPSNAVGVLNEHPRRTSQRAEKDRVKSVKKRRRNANAAAKGNEKSSEEVSTKVQGDSAESKDSPPVKGYSESEQQEIYDAVHSLQILAKRQSPSRSSSSVTDRNRIEQ